MGVKQQVTTLIIAPHMDDESLSCGGLVLSRVRANTHVKIVAAYGRVYDYGKVTVHDSFPAEHNDFITATSILGVTKSNVEAWNLREGEPHTVGYYTTLRLVEQALDVYQPTEVIIPPADDMNQDHRFLHDVCKIALRPTNLGRVKKVLSFVALDGLIRDAQYLVEMDSETFGVKLRAIKAYRSEIRKGFHQRAEHNIVAMAKVYGAKIGVEYAEPYNVYLQRE